VSEFVLDASVALQWFLDDELDREYSLGILASLSQRRAIVPLLWFYEVGNGLVMAYRRKRITLEQVDGFLMRLKPYPSTPHRKYPLRFLSYPLLPSRTG
jgi:predicted nucleic acid-binding protein